MAALQWSSLSRSSRTEKSTSLWWVYRQITDVDPNAKITIATRSHASAIKSQFGDSVAIYMEPCRRDTFTASVLAASYLHDELGADENEVVVACPVNP